MFSKLARALLVIMLAGFVLSATVTALYGDCGDVDNSGGADIDDVVYLIQYIFGAGPEPDCGGPIGTVTDFDGNLYYTVKIGDQWWMLENLRVTHYRNGDPIPNVTDGITWLGLSAGAYCDFDNDPANAETFGRFYNWYAVDDSRNIAPEGWHVPTDAEWKQLEMYLGMSQAEADGTTWRGTDEGGKLKEIGTTHWIYPNEGATNESGFSALAGGYRDFGGTFGSVGITVHFWSSTEYDSPSPFGWDRTLYYEYSEVGRWGHYKTYGFSVRCVRD